MSAKYIVNGQSYNSLDEMPPDVRHAYEQAMSLLGDEDKDGIPDILEGQGALGKLFGEKAGDDSPSIHVTNTIFGSTTPPRDLSLRPGATRPTTSDPHALPDLVKVVGESNGSRPHSTTILLALVFALTLLSAVLAFFLLRPFGLP